MADSPPPSPSPFVNLADPRQDVHRVRAHSRDLHRYAAAERLIPERRGRILDLGGGIGEMARRLRSRGFDVTIADLSESNVTAAAAEGFDAKLVDLNFPLPFQDGSYDGVVALDVVEHIVAAEQLLSEVQRVLTPGGFLVLTTPNFGFFLNRIGILAGRLTHDEGYHYRFFNPGVLNARLRAAGLVVEETAHSMPAFGLNFIRSRLMNRSRLHVDVARPLAPLFAHTLIVRARKPGP